LSAFIRDRPPKPTLDESLDHGPVVASSNVGLPLLGAVGKVVTFEVEIDVDVVADHVLPQKINIAFDSLVVDHVLFFSQLTFCPL
jgi:hypothetical protein